LLVVIATVAAIAPLCVGSRAGGSDYSENKSQRYQSATKSFFHFSPSVENGKCNHHAALFTRIYGGLIPISTYLVQTRCSICDTDFLESERPRQDETFLSQLSYTFES